MKTAIIGSGIAGLACAIRLANKGHQVTVFEANDYPGGKLSEIQLGKYSLLLIILNTKSSILFANIFGRMARR